MTAQQDLGEQTDLRKNRKNSTIGGRTRTLRKCLYSEKFRSRWSTAGLCIDRRYERCAA